MVNFAVRPRVIPRTGDDTPERSLIRYVWRMSGQHQVWICLVSLLVAAVSMVPLELQRRIIDDAVRNTEINLLFILGATYLVVLLVHGAAKFLLRMYQGWLSESAIRYNREHLARIHERRGDAAREEADGRVVSIVGAEVDKLGGFVGEGLSQPVANLGMLCIISGYMVTVEPLIALLSLAFLVPQVVVVPFVQQFINALIEKRVSLLRNLSDNLVQLPIDDSELTHQLDGIFANRMQTFLLKFALKVFINFLNALTPLVVLVVGGYLVIKGETTIGIVVAFMSGFDRLANPLRELIAYYRFAAQASVQHKMIAKWMVQPEI